MNVIKALIAARSGSLRVPNKNIRQFADTTLLENKIEQLFRIKELEGVVVNSNDESILEIAKKHGCEIVKRNQSYATNTVCMSDVYVNIAENFDADIMLYANCTNPLLKDSTIINAIRTYYNVCSDFDSLNSAHLIKEFLFKDNLPINYILNKQPRSQDLPDIYALNFAINIIPKNAIIKQHNIVGKNPYIFKIDEMEAIDIDNQIDFDLAEFFFKRKYND